MAWLSSWPLHFTKKAGESSTHFHHFLGCLLLYVLHCVIDKLHKLLFLLTVNFQIAYFLVSADNNFHIALFFGVPYLLKLLLKLKGLGAHLHKTACLFKFVK